jgi:energy-coupling factor transporter ATP-binding protein EcfA2
MISLKNVSYTYPGTEKRQLKDISLDMPDGQFCAIVGANGAGKSTLAYTITGFIPHFYRGTLIGKVQVAGLQTISAPLSEQVLHTGLVFQNPFNQISGTKFTVREEIAFGLENLGVPREEMLERIEAVMKMVGITDLAERFPLSLSGGQMQRVAIASVCAMKPRVLVLDEPTSQLDPVGSREVFSAIRGLASERQITVVMIEHKLEWLAVYADRMIALAEGEIIGDGLPVDVLVDEKLISRGVGGTRYTQVARQAQRLGYWPKCSKLAVTLEEAVVGFCDQVNS